LSSSSNKTTKDHPVSTDISSTKPTHSTYSKRGVKMKTLDSLTPSRLLSIPPYSKISEKNVDKKVSEKTINIYDIYDEKKSSEEMESVGHIYNSKENFKEWGDDWDDVYVDNLHEKGFHHSDIYKDKW
jgi:hypothetical protein